MKAILIDKVGLCPQLCGLSCTRREPYEHSCAGRPPSRRCSRIGRFAAERPAPGGATTRSSRALFLTRLTRSSADALSRKQMNEIAPLQQFEVPESWRTLGVDRARRRGVSRFARTSFVPARFTPMETPASGERLSGSLFPAHLDKATCDGSAPARES